MPPRLVAAGRFAGPYGVAFDGTSIWVANSIGNSVGKLRANDGSTVTTHAVGKNPFGVVFDGGHIWVTNADSGTVTKL